MNSLKRVLTVQKKDRLAGSNKLETGLLLTLPLLPRSFDDNGRS